MKTSKAIASQIRQARSPDTPASFYLHFRPHGHRRSQAAGKVFHARMADRHELENRRGWRELEAKQIALGLIGKPKAQRQAAARKFRELVPEAERRSSILNEICENMLFVVEKSSKLTPAQLQAEEKQRAQALQRIESEEKVLAIAEQVLNGVAQLTKAALIERSPLATERLAHTALITTAFISGAIESHTDTLKREARFMRQWPVLATADSKEWFSRAQNDIKRLELGADWPGIRATRRTSSKARLWAQRALAVIFENRFSGAAALAGRNAPQWLHDCALIPGPFNREHFLAWWKTASAMIKQQCPKFAEHEDWKDVRGWPRTQNSRCQVMPGKLRAAVLGKIRSAMYELAGA